MKEELDPSTFNQERYEWLKSRIEMMATKKRLVPIINQYLEKTFVKEDTLDLL